MAIWEMRVVAANGTRNYENVYHIDTGTATDIAAAVIEAAITFHVSRTLAPFTILRVARRLLGTHNEFIDVSVDTPGAIPLDGGVPLPLWNTVAVLLFGGVGREGVKLLRGMLVAGNLSGSEGLINPAVVSAIQGAWNTFQDAVEAAGQHIVYGSANKIAASGDVQGVARMRQEHRKRKKKLL